MLNIIFEFTGNTLFKYYNQTFTGDAHLYKRYPQGVYAVLLYNDETHSFKDVIDQLKLAIDCDDAAGKSMAEVVDIRGREVIYISDDLKSCKKIASVIQRIGLQTGISLVSDTANEYLISLLLKWIIENCQKSSGLRRLVCETLNASLSEDIVSQVDPKMRKPTNYMGLLLWADHKLWKEIRNGFKELVILTLLVDPLYRREFASTFADQYEKLCCDFFDNDREPDLSAVFLSIQLFTTPSIASYLVKERNIVQEIITILDKRFREALITKMGRNVEESQQSIIGHSNSIPTQFMEGEMIEAGEEEILDPEEELLQAVEIPEVMMDFVGNDDEAEDEDERDDEDDAYEYSDDDDFPPLAENEEAVNNSVYPTPQIGERVSVEFNAALLDCNHPFVQKKRYFQVFYDLRYLLNTKGVQQQIKNAHLRTEGFPNKSTLISFMDMLKMFEAMDPQTRQHDVHIEFESETWINAFNLSLQISRLLKPLVDAFIYEERGDEKHFEHLMALISSNTLEDKLGHTTMRTIQLDGDRIDIIHYRISTSQISFHYPLHWLLGRAAMLLPGNYPTINPLDLFNRIINTISPDGLTLEYFAQKLMEPALRLRALNSQVRGNHWVRNGFTMKSQIINYTGIQMREECFDCDMMLLFLGSVLMNTSSFVLSVLDRFELLELCCTPENSTSKSVWDTNNTDILFQEYQVQAVEDVLELFIAMITDKKFLLDPESTFEAVMQREVIHHLFLGPLTFSELEKRIPDRFTNNKKFIDIVKKVSNFKFPTSMTEKGVYSLKEEYYREINPFFSHYSKKDRNLAAEKFKGIPDFYETSVFYNFEFGNHPEWDSKVDSILGNGFFQSFMVKLFAIRSKLNDGTNESLIFIGNLISRYYTDKAKTKYVMEIACILKEMFVEESSKSSNEGKDKRIYSILLQLDPSLVADLDLKDNSKKESTKEDKRKKAMERQAAMLKKMQKTQQKVLDNFKDEDMEDHEESSSLIAEDRIHKQWKLPTGNCMLCQEELSLTSQKEYGCVGYLQPSRMVRKLSCDQLNSSAVKEANDVTDQVVKHHDFLAHAGYHLNSCNHLIHLSCYTEHMKQLKQSYLQRRGNVANIVRGDFLCPLCKSISNCLVPIIGYWNIKDSDLSALNIRGLFRNEMNMESWEVDEKELNDEEPKSSTDSSVSAQTSPPTSMPNVNVSISNPFSRLFAGEFTNPQDIIGQFVNTIVQGIQSETQQVLISPQDDRNEDEESDVFLPGYGFKIMKQFMSSLSKKLVANRCWSQTSLCKVFAYTCSGIEAAFSNIETNGILQTINKANLLNNNNSSSMEYATPLTNNSYVTLKLLSDLNLCLLKARQKRSNANLIKSERVKSILLNQGDDPDYFYNITVLTFYLNPVKDLNLFYALLKIVFLHHLQSVIKAVLSLPSKAKSGTKLRDDQRWGKFFGNRVESELRIEEFENAISNLLYPFLRRCAILVHIRFDIPLPNMFEFCKLCDNLNLFSSWDEFLKLNVVATNEVRDSLLDDPFAYNLVNIPVRYDLLFPYRDSNPCENCRLIPTDPALCLFCSKVVCAQSYCCMKNDIGECNQHASECGKVGLFLLLQRGVILCVYDGYGCILSSPYLDMHGEMDPGLKRGNPLFLIDGRYKEIRNLWLSQSLPSVIIRKLDQSYDMGGWTFF
jgi:E3 ubiquitin-protein ligase UBR1